MLGPRKEPTRRQAGERRAPPSGRPTAVYRRQNGYQMPRGTAKSSEAIVPPGLSVRASCGNAAEGRGGGVAGGGGGGPVGWGEPYGERSGAGGHVQHPVPRAQPEPGEEEVVP